MPDDRGHRVIPHTADVILEAWGPDLPACCEEAVAALAATYVERAGATEVERRTVHFPADSNESLLVAVLDEVIFTLDTAEGVPVAAEVAPSDDGGLDVTLILADSEGVEAAGAVPKAVSRSELAVDAEPDRVSCRFLVDV